MNIKKFLKIQIIIFMFLFLFLGMNSFAESDEKYIEDFSGTRTFTIDSDLSNLKNYIEGGRSSLEFVIRQNKIDWLNLDISSDEYDLKLTYSFDFTSYEDYTEKVEQLLTYEPVIINEKNNYIEGFSTKDLANYLKDGLQENDLYLPDTEDIELFLGEDSKITFKNGDELEAKDDRIKSNESSDAALKLSNLKINTNFKDGVYTRKINFEISAEGSELNSIKKGFIDRCKKEKVEYKNSTENSFEVEFEAKNLTELSGKTMILLNVGVNIDLKDQYKSQNILNEIYTEHIDVSDLLDEEADFEYSFDVSNFENANLVQDYDQDDGFTLENNIFKVETPKNIIKFEYQKKFEFDEVKIITDLTNDFKIVRTISLKTRTVIAKNIHDDIKESLINSLPNEVTLNIYDKGAYRYYDIVFEGNVNKINSLTSKITDGEANLKVDQKMFKFIPSKIEDNVTVDTICNYVENYPNLKQEYKFNKDTKLIEDDEELAITTEKTGEQLVDFESGKISITYKKFDKVLFSIIVILVIIVIVVIILIRKKIRKIKKAKEDKKKSKGEKSGK